MPNIIQDTDADIKSANKLATPPRIRLDFLDGIRGLAALNVVMHHAFFEVVWWQEGYGPHIDHGEQLSAVALRLTHWLTYGHIAVNTFIVLSGYCLMLPLARTGTWTLPDGFWNYVKRRAQRILPPYYAALALSLAALAVIPGFNKLQGVRWDLDLPAFTPGVLVSHLLLVHNLYAQYAGKIDYPMWSVATEWQIYFLFPLLLLPLARRWGPYVPIIVGLLIGVVPVWLFDHNKIHHDFSQAFPWYAGLFATGMLGALLTFDIRPRTMRWLGDRPLLVYIAVTLVVWKFGSDYRILDDWKADSVYGLAVCLIIVYCARFLTSERSHKPPLVLKLLESSFATKLGIFSYSLYLVHAPILAALHMWIRPLHFSGAMAAAFLVLIGTPICVGFAYLFHRAFERPFMRLPSAHDRRTQA
jgi:peptidoglycan/LPS O-acetylase OafA/YrhL